MTLLDTVKDVIGGRRAAAERTYRRLVAQPDAKKAADAEALADALRELGKRPEDFAADVAAVGRAAEIRHHMPAPELLTGKRADAEAWTLSQARALAMSRNRRRELMAEFRRETDRENALAAALNANAPRREAEELEERAEGLQAELEHLRRSHPLAPID